MSRFQCRPGANKCPTSGADPVLLDSVLVKPAETLCEVPAQRDGEDVDEAEKSEGVEQNHRVLQEGQSCVDST